jgi:malyl-CoA/(S)-citramalyl-CoA lyase
MVDACATHGIYPYYGPFGDIADVVACEDQFRNAFLLGCVGTWSLHPKQIAIANKVFSPSVEDIKHARRVVAAMGDEQLAAIDPELKKQYDAIEVD